jgi:RHS repeat-associated protein
MKNKLDSEFEEDDLGFTGKGYDSDVGLYYFNARWYDADTGRFISEDPVGDPSNPNLYTYGRNNPLSFNDPTGLASTIAVNGGTYDTGTGKFTSDSGNEGGIGGENPGTGGPPKITYGPNDSKKYVDEHGHTIVPWGYFLDGVPIEGGESGYRLLQMVLENYGYDPLVFLHGYTDDWTLWAPYIDMIVNILGSKGSNETVFRDLAKQFKKSTDPKEKANILSTVQSLARAYNIYIFDYSDSNTDSPKNIAPMFVNFLKENNIFDKTPNIIAHSMGNLVAREAIEYHGLVVHNFAMVAPPNRGSLLATIFRWHKATQYMSYDSKDLARLNKPENISKLQAGVTGLMAIFQAEGDPAIGNNYTIPGLNIPVMFYQEGVYPGQVAITGASGTHGGICHDNYGVVLSGLMGFMNN